MSVLNAALSIARAGLPVFPCGASKRPAIAKEAGGRGFYDATADEPAIRALFARADAVLIGVPTGEKSGFDVLDFDYRHGAAEWEAANAHRIPPTRTHRTTSGGRHLLFRHGPGVRNLASKFAAGMDVRGDGGYVIMPLSRGYSIENDAPIAAWPAWLLALVLPPPPRPFRPIVLPTGGEAARRYAIGALRRAVERIAAAREGQRNDTLNAECFSMVRFVREGWLGPTEVADALAVAAAHAGLAPRETAATIASALRAGGVA